MSQEITIENVKKFLDENRKYPFKLPQGHIGKGVYRIADNCLTNEAGWNQYLEALKKAGEKYAH